MASVTIIRPPVCSDAALEVPRQQWPMLLGERVNFCKYILPRDCRMLLFFIEDAQKAEWMGFKDREAYLHEGLHLDPQMVDLAVRGLEISDPNKPLGYDPAIVLGKRGRPRKGEEKVYSINLKSKGGTRRTYILARLDRDGQAELAMMVRAGVISASKAAKEAGYRKELTPFEKIIRLVTKLTAAQRRKLKAML
jgi:hypothetical protein